MNERATLHFTLWGIPVSIYPISWILLFFLGGGMRLDSGEGLADTLLFMLAGMLCLIVHEMGHAVVGRQLTGCLPSIAIAGAGGMTYTPRLPRTRAGYFALVFAGPLASLTLGISAGCLFGLQIGAPVAGIIISLLAPLPVQLPSSCIAHVMDAGLPPLLLTFYLQLFGVCVWWTIFNLLPIFPLDGGKMLATLLNSERVACITGLIFGGLLCSLCIIWAVLGNGSWFNAFITGYLVYINYQYLRPRS